MVAERIPDPTKFIYRFHSIGLLSLSCLERLGSVLSFRFVILIEIAPTRERSRDDLWSIFLRARATNQKSMKGGLKVHIEVVPGKSGAILGEF